MAYRKQSLATREKISLTLKRKGIKPLVRWNAKGTKYSPERRAKLMLSIERKWKDRRVKKNWVIH